MQRKCAAKTDVGRRRSVNEDAYLVDNDAGLYVVADGMGGHAAGEIASAEAVDQVHGMIAREFAVLNKVAQGDTSAETLRRAVRALESAVQAATYMVFSLGQVDPDQKGMGTTLSALCVCGNVAITAQVGDSRIYRIRENAPMRLTEDHTLVAWQIKQGIITEEEAERVPHRNVITRAVGSREYVQVDTNVIDIMPGDSFLLCSDGLHGYLQEDEIAPIIAKGAEPAVERFIDLANERGGKDNITAIAVYVG